MAYDYLDKRYQILQKYFKNAHNFIIINIKLYKVMLKGQHNCIMKQFKIIPKQLNTIKTMRSLCK